MKQSMQSAAAVPPPKPAHAAKSIPQTANAEAFDFDKPEVESHVDRFQTSRRGFFNRALERAGRYLPSLTNILKSEGLPEELAYLPLIESGYQDHAVSPAGAAGPWQFIKGTGRRYGLRIDSLVDERRDPIKSTHAAAQYLKDLHDMFGDWQLALAGYNTGEYRVAKIRDNRGVDDFWEMRERGYLPRETSEYVPSFLAAVRIASAPEDYGFDTPASDPLLLGEFETIEVDRQVSLHAAAGMCGVSTEELKELNPALSRGITPIGYSLRVPPGKAEPLRTQLASYVEPVQPARARRAIARGTGRGSRDTSIAQSNRRPSVQITRGKAARTTMARAQGPKGKRAQSQVARAGTQKGRGERTAMRDTPTQCGSGSSSCAAASKLTAPPAGKWQKIGKTTVAPTPEKKGTVVGSAKTPTKAQPAKRDSDAKPAKSKRKS